MPPTIYAACAAGRSERPGPLSATQAEPDNLRTLTAVIDTPAQRAESAIWLYDRTANVTFCGWSCPWPRAVR
jgi:hypothetical protein